MRNATAKFLKNRVRLLTACLALYAAYLVFAFVFFGSQGLLWILHLLAPPLVLELALRLVLHAVYGRHYRYALFSYFFVDHPVYGYTFRANASARRVPFLIFDKFAFRGGAEQSLALRENINGRTDFNVNSRGYRGPEFSPKKNNPNTIRIFTSGDSATVCAFNDDAETWPARLERELRARGLDVEVINAGMGAWPLYQQRLRFEREIVNYEPDVVLLHAGWNEEFIYSMQNLGKSWRPEMLLNSVELKTMYSHVGPVLSSTISLLFHSLVASYFYDYRFKKNMNFASPARWACLQAREYLENWFDNLVKIAALARDRGIKLYTINHPGLPTFEDTEVDRKLYVRYSKLTPIYADYQAVSKKRVQKALLEATPIATCIDVEREMDSFTGQARLDFFYDKIHLSPKGNAVLAKIISEKLLADPGFLQKGSNVNYDEALAKSIRNKIGQNEKSLQEFIDRTIVSLQNTP